MGVLGEMFPRKRIHEDSDAAQGGQPWQLGPIDLDKGVVTVGPVADPEAPEETEPGTDTEPRTGTGTGPDRPS
ncbi:hypothetical protein [Pseudonocardia parietis]|uniref:ATP-grasp target RiPP n=1 Tax=Pseudonocardia parietis TaxID=570936 RepID=A0ABS4VPS8_9PSEU|nr:hypothetical protein [Pseudonocardia parietis]MBP2365927.1 hypothetical protein [Pseudonocardia parietis]